MLEMLTLLLNVDTENSVLLNVDTENSECGNITSLGLGIYACIFSQGYQDTACLMHCSKLIAMEHVEECRVDHFWNTGCWVNFW